MTAEEKQIIYNFYLRTITYEQMKEEYPHTIDLEYIYAGLKQAYQDKDSAAVEYLIALGYNEGFDEKIGWVLSELMVEDWHTEHEEITRILQFKIRIPECVDHIATAMNADFAHIRRSGSEKSFLKKCAYVLSYLGTEYAKEKLIQLSNSKNEDIKEAALHQLKKLANKEL